MLHNGRQGFFFKKVCKGGDKQIITRACIIKVCVADSGETIGESVGQKIICVIKHEYENYFVYYW